MVHFTCDLCGKDLTDAGNPRFVVKIEAYAGFDPTQITEDDLDDDHMEAVAQLLQRDEEMSAKDFDAQIRKGFRFDLCSCCHGKFLKDPLGRESIRAFDFSKN